MVSRPAVGIAGGGRELEKASNQPVIPVPTRTSVNRILFWMTKEWGSVCYWILRLKKCGTIELHVNNGTVTAVSWTEGPRDEK
jgi:hypothetical protein